MVKVSQTIEKTGRRGSRINTYRFHLKAVVSLPRIKRSSSLLGIRRIFHHLPLEIEHHFAVFIDKTALTASVAALISVCVTVVLSDIAQPCLPLGDIGQFRLTSAESIQLQQECCGFFLLFSMMMMVVVMMMMVNLTRFLFGSKPVAFKKQIETPQPKARTHTRTCHRVRKVCKYMLNHNNQRHAHTYVQPHTCSRDQV